MQSQVSCKSIYRTCHTQRIVIITIINKAMLWLTLQRTTKAWMRIPTGWCFQTIWTYYRTQVYYRKISNRCIYERKYCFYFFPWNYLIYSSLLMQLHFINFFHLFTLHNSLFGIFCSFHFSIQATCYFWNILANL